MIKQQSQKTWAGGDYSKIAMSMVIMSELLCETAGVCAGQTVLDVATGSGNTKPAMW